MSAVAGSIPDARVADLFAGSGALGLEALSRGARHVTFVENAAGAIAVLRKNLADLGAPADAVTLVRADAVRFVESLPPRSYDLAFADPPYGRGFALRLAEIFTNTPFARLLCIEHGNDEPLDGFGAARQRRYGDTLLTFLSADDE